MTRFDRRARGAVRALASAAIGLVLLAPAARAALVEVAVTGIADARGHVRVDLCTKSTFLTSDCPYQGEAKATPGATVIMIAGVAPGQYAAQAFHDVSDEGTVHQNLLGIPREKIGFSNDAPLHLRGPHFDDAAFPVGLNPERITFRLRRLFRRAD